MNFMITMKRGNIWPQNMLQKNNTNGGKKEYSMV
jgi:hypothetical protein